MSDVEQLYAQQLSGGLVAASFPDAKRDGSVPSIEELYAAHMPRAVQLAAAMAPAGGCAEDIAHDAFIKCASRLGGLRSPEKFAPYLHRAVVSAAIDASRSARRRQAREDGFSHDRSSASGELREPGNLVAARLDVGRLLSGLSERQRAAVLLRYWLDYSERDVARALKCRPGTVKSLLARALNQLKEDIREQ